MTGVELVKLAVIGLGHMGTAMAINAHKSGRAVITALCDSSSVALENAVKQFNAVAHYIPSVFSSYEELIQNGDYDGIIIACNPQVQASLSIAEMKRN